MGAVFISTAVAGSNGFPGVAEWGSVEALGL